MVFTVERMRMLLVRGRPMQEDAEANVDGIILRNLLKDKISNGQWIRPKTNWYRLSNRVLME